MASIRQIARQAGVSITTVSRALNNDPAVKGTTRERVLSVANRAGYVATMGRRNTANIGLAYTGGQTLSTVFDTSVLEGIVRGVNEHRFDVLILNPQRDKEESETYTQFFMRKGVRGVVLRTTARTRDVCTAIAKEGFPHIVISDRFDHSVVNFIDCDSREDSARAVEYLIALGHRRIAFVTNVVPDCDHIDRYEGYQKALKKHSLPFDESLTLRQPANLAGGRTVMGLVNTMRPRPTAIFCADPILAVGAVNTAHAVGLRVPEDISVVGFDDSDIRHSVFPTLTAVCQDASALGFEAALGLTRILSGEVDTGFQSSAPAFFEVNESTGPPPGTEPKVETVAGGAVA
jgi:DNA-binding LacI/PurR family transcriptional regulator